MLDIASQVELYVAVGTTQIPSVAHFIIFLRIVRTVNVDAYGLGVAGANSPVCGRLQNYTTS